MHPRGLCPGLRAVPDSDANANSHADAHANPNPNSDSHANPNPNSDSHANSHADTNANSDSDTHSESDTKPDPGLLRLSESEQLPHPLLHAGGSRKVLEEAPRVQDRRLPRRVGAEQAGFLVDSRRPSSRGWGNTIWRFSTACHVPLRTHAEIKFFHENRSFLILPRWSFRLALRVCFSGL